MGTYGKSAQEWSILCSLWKHKTLTIKELVEILNNEAGYKSNQHSLGTVVRRLRKKGLVEIAGKVEKSGRGRKEMVFQPTESQRVGVTARLMDFLECRFPEGELGQTLIDEYEDEEQPCPLEKEPTAYEWKAMLGTWKAAGKKGGEATCQEIRAEIKGLKVKPSVHELYLFLNNMVKKGFIESRKGDNTVNPNRFYSPAIGERIALKWALDSELRSLPDMKQGLRILKGLAAT